MEQLQPPLYSAFQPIPSPGRASQLAEEGKEPEGLMALAQRDFTPGTGLA